MNDILQQSGQFPRLETPRLILREITDFDAEAILRIHGDENHMKWFGIDPIASISESKRVISVFSGWRQQQPNSGTRWGLERKEAPGLIGTCGLFAWNHDWRKCERACLGRSDIGGVSTTICFSILCSGPNGRMASR
jgi:RimJ/RimL family protein N-acetyltransferase